MKPLALADVESRLALFAEGITGRYLHIKATAEARWQSQLTFSTGAQQSADSLYLPTELESESEKAYHLLTLQQIGLRECGTFTFSLTEMQRRLPELDDSEHHAHRRDSDLTRFFAQFARPSFARRVFLALEEYRITHHMLATYPGTRQYFDAFCQQQLAMSEADLPGAIQQLSYGSFYDPFDLSDRLRDLHGADVYASALLTWQLREWFDSEPLQGHSEEESVSAVEWQQREARLEDWEDELQQKANQLLAVEMLEAEEAMSKEMDGLQDGDTRQTDITLHALQQEKDDLKRRVDMERSAIRYAIGPDQGVTRSYRYDEWDYLNRRYLKKWCRLYEHRCELDPDANTNELKTIVARWLHPVKTQLEQIRPMGLQRIKRVLDGDELDLNAVLEARQDVRAGVTPDERTYSRRDRVQRDVCTAFLVDLSASTDDPLEPPEPVFYDEDAAPMNLRDPFEDHPMFASDAVEDSEQVRKIIDVQREAMLVMASALDILGDSFGVYGFSGYGHDCVEYFVAKEISEDFNMTSLRAIASMQPKRSTRMGPAIRHAVHKLLRAGNALKVLMIISDGFPQDCDYGPERGEHEYGVQDTAQALREAHQKGVETFCVTVDKSGHDYLKRMCPESRYLVIEEIEDLPEALTKVYAALTTR